MRPTFPEIYMKLALILAERSTCKRRCVGCVLVTREFKSVLSVGYNGNASGLPNTCDRPLESGSCGCLHAEENAIINCDAPRSIEKVAFVTTMPCVMCAKRFINLGNVKKVYYSEAYHNAEGIELLHSVGIEVEQLTIKP